MVEASGSLPHRDEEGAAQDVGGRVLERLPVLGLAGVSHYASLALLHLAVAFLQVRLHVSVCEENYSHKNQGSSFKRLRVSSRHRNRSFTPSSDKYF